MQNFSPQRWVTAYRDMILNSTSLVATSGFTSALGFVYWWVAAHQVAPSALGFASATLSAMTLLATIGIFGFGTLIIAEFPKYEGAETSLIATVASVTAISSSTLATLFALIAPMFSADFRLLSANLGNVILFTSGVALATVTSVIDQALVGLLRGSVQLWRNIVFSSVKLGALVIASIWMRNTYGLTIYATWAAGNAISLIVLFATRFRSRDTWHQYRPHWRMLRGLSSTALKHHCLNLSLKFPLAMLPLIVVGVLSAEMNAYFSVAITVAFFVFAIPIALCDVLYALGAANRQIFAKQLRTTVRLATVTGVLTNGVLFVVGSIILRAFGHSYADHATWPLRIITLSVFPLIVKDHYVTISRVRGTIGVAAAFTATGAVFEILAAAIGAHIYGLSGLCVAWVFIQCIEAAVLAPAVLAVLRSHDDTELTLRYLLPPTARESGRSSE